MINVTGFFLKCFEHFLVVSLTLADEYLNKRDWGAEYSGSLRFCASVLFSEFCNSFKLYLAVFFVSFIFNSCNLTRNTCTLDLCYRVYQKIWLIVCMLAFLVGLFCSS